MATLQPEIMKFITDSIEHQPLRQITSMPKSVKAIFLPGDSIRFRVEIHLLTFTGKPDFKILRNGFGATAATAWKRFAIPSPIAKES